MSLKFFWLGVEAAPVFILARLAAPELSVMPVWVCKGPDFWDFVALYCPSEAFLSSNMRYLFIFYG